jgi:hypothetical protein
MIDDAPTDDELEAEDMLMAGHSMDRVVTDLVGRGWTSEKALLLVNRVADYLRNYYGSPEIRKWHSSIGWREFLGGIAMVLLGAALLVSVILLQELQTSVLILSAVLAVGLIFCGVICTRLGRKMLRSFRAGRLPFEQPESKQDANLS